MIYVKSTIKDTKGSRKFHMAHDFNIDYCNHILKGYLFNQK